MHTAQLYFEHFVENCENSTCRYWRIHSIYLSLEWLSYSLLLCRQVLLGNINRPVHIALFSIICACYTRWAKKQDADRSLVHIFVRCWCKLVSKYCQSSFTDRLSRKVAKITQQLKDVARLICEIFVFQNGQVIDVLFFCDLWFSFSTSLQNLLLHV